jgi:hypothetical protein
MSHHVSISNRLFQATGVSSSGKYILIGVLPMEDPCDILRGSSWAGSSLIALPTTLKGGAVGRGLTGTPSASFGRDR